MVSLPCVQHGILENLREESEGKVTLKEWAEGWPYRLHKWHDSTIYSVPDSVLDKSWRAQAFSLDDYVVSSVCGGSLWFVPRDMRL